MYSLRMSFCTVPRSLSPRDTLLFRDELVEQQQQRSGCVDRHRRRDLVERDPVEEQLHVGDRVDRDAGPCRPRRPRADRPSRSRAASAGRTRPTSRSGRDRAGSGSAGSSLPRMRTPRTAGSSTDGPRYMSGYGPRVNGNSPGSSSAPGRVLGRVDRLDLDVRVGVPLVAGGGHARIVCGLRGRAAATCSGRRSGRG